MAGGVGGGGEDWEGVVDPVLQEVVVGSGRVGGEPFCGDFGEVVAACLELVAADVEEVVCED